MTVIQLDVRRCRKRYWTQKNDIQLNANIYFNRRGAGNSIEFSDKMTKFQVLSILIDLDAVEALAHNLSGLNISVRIN